MRSAVLLAAGATIVAATHPTRDRLEQRDAAECSSVYLELLPDVLNTPIPDSSLAEFIATQTQAIGVTVPCEIPAITGSFAEEYTSWASEMVSWYSHQKEAVSDLLSACSDVTDASDELAAMTQYIASCDAQRASQTESSSSSGSSSSGDDSSGAGVTSIKAAIALAIAGIAGVIIML